MSAKLDDAIACIVGAMTVNTDSLCQPACLRAASASDATPKRLYERTSLDANRTERLRAGADHRNDPTPTRRLRIGYVSGDFREHEQACRILPSGKRDPGRFECLLFEPARAIRSLRNFSRRSMGGATLHDTDAQARAGDGDKIDILVDLDSHGRRIG